RIVVVLELPKKETSWLNVSAAKLVIKRCAYWASLRRKPELPYGQESVTIEIPAANRFDIDGLRKLMEAARWGDIRCRCASLTSLPWRRSVLRRCGHTSFTRGGRSSNLLENSARFIRGLTVNLPASSSFPLRRQQAIMHRRSGRLCISLPRSR